MVIMLPKMPIRFLGVLGLVVAMVVFVVLDQCLANSTATVPPWPKPRKWIRSSDHPHSSRRWWRAVVRDSRMSVGFGEEMGSPRRV